MRYNVSTSRFSARCDLPDISIGQKLQKGAIFCSSSISQRGRLALPFCCPLRHGAIVSSLRRTRPGQPARTLSLGRQCIEAATLPPSFVTGFVVRPEGMQPYAGSARPNTPSHPRNLERL